MSGYLYEVGLWVISLFVFICFLCISYRVSSIWGCGFQGKGLGVCYHKIIISKTCCPQGLLEPQKKRLVRDVMETGACEI